MRWLFLVPALILICPTAPKAQAFADDAESQGVLSSDSPAGMWSYENPSSPCTGCSFSNEASAAHRGQRGLRMTDVAGTTGPSGEQVGLVASFSSMSGAYHVRFWFRVQQTNNL